MIIPEFYEERNLEHDLIIEICRRVDGIGKTTAIHIASYIDTVLQFRQCTVDDLMAVKKKTGASLLKPELANEIVSERERYLPSGVTDLRQIWVTYLIRDFVERAIKEIRATDFEKLLINRFLFQAFNFSDHKEFVTF